MISMARHHKYHRRYYKPHYRPYNRPSYQRPVQYQTPIDYRFKIGIIFIIVGIVFFVLSFIIVKLGNFGDSFFWGFIGVLCLLVGLIIISPAGRKKQNVNVVVSQR
jgi:hypothetical protein